MNDDLSVDVMESLRSGGWVPNIQQYLIDEGVKFDNSFVTNSLCCPSRATYLRGQYSHTHRVRSNRYGCDLKGIEWPGWFPSEGEAGRSESTIATWLKSAGYATGYVGRYLNGYGEAAPPGVADPKLYIPAGWDDWQGLVDPSTYRVYDYEINDNGALATYGSAEEDYQTDVLAARAVEFIEEQPGDAPFFLTIMPFAPHLEVLDVETLPPCGDSPPVPLTIRPAPRHAHLNDGDPSNGEIPELAPKPSFDEADTSDKPTCGSDLTFGPRCPGDFPRLSAPHINLVEDQFRAMSTAMFAVDDLVGAVVQALQAKGVFDNTVVMFSSDNGWMFGEHRLNAKNLPYEESIRVPLYVRPAGGGGAVATQIVVNNDLAPSLAELGGATPPYDPDGRSLVPLLVDPGSATWDRKRFLVAHYYSPPGDFATALALRQQSGPLDFLFVNWFGNLAQPGTVTGREFYHLGFDPYQQQSVTLPGEITSALEAALAELGRCEGAGCRMLEAF
jgi:arylsulfatase A-like enzyme